ncbi:hypothetical protein C0992_009222, partial [Termitomyces sp. T32_za158]
MEQDEGFIQTLPSHILAEVGAYREDQEHSHRLAARDVTIRGPPISANTNRKPVHQHDAIQLLDKAGIAVLVRLLFFPQVLKKTLLYKVLVNLCENARSRTELFNLLLSILQDGTGDLAAVDKSFAQMSVRNTKGPTAKTLGKQKATLDYLSALDEVIPDLLVQRCLEALTFIVSSNELSSLFFLTEHELPVGLRRSASKKGKGKEKQAPQTHYPIVLLLGLLDRQSLLKTPAIMESVVGLLATVTRPLASLKDKGSDADHRTSTSNGPTATETERMQVTEGEDVVVPQTNPTVEQPTAGSLITGAANPDTATRPPPSIEAIEEKILLANPPQIPHAVLRFIVNILTVGECSGRTFQQSLVLIQHLSYVPDARDVIAQELKAKAQEAGQILSSDLDELLIALQGSQGDLLSSVAS